MKRAAFVAAACGHASCHAAKLALPLFTLSLAAGTFGVEPAQVGWAASAFTLSMGAASLPAGLAGDRFGTGRLLTAYYWLLCLAGLACATAQGFGGFLTACALLGLAAGSFHPAGLGLVSLVTPKERVGRAMGLFGVAGSLGQAAMPLLMGSALGFRLGYFSLSAVGLVGALACHQGLRAGWLPTGLGAAPRALAREGPRRNQLLVLLLAVMGLNAFVSSGWETIFPQTVADQHLVTLAPWVISTAVLVVGGVGQYVGGILARDAFAASRLALIMVIQCLVLLGTATALDESLLPFAFLGSFAFFNYGTQPIENRLLAAFTSARRRSSAYALKFVVALLLAAPAPWIVAGLYEDAGGSQAAFRLLSSVALLGVFASYFFLRGSHPSRRASTGAGATRS